MSTGRLPSAVLCAVAVLPVFCSAQRNPGTPGAQTGATTTTTTTTTTNATSSNGTTSADSPTLTVGTFTTTVSGNGHTATLIWPSFGNNATYSAASSGATLSTTSGGASASQTTSSTSSSSSATATASASNSTSDAAAAEAEEESSGLALLIGVVGGALVCAVAGLLVLWRRLKKRTHRMLPAAEILEEPELLMGKYEGKGIPEELEAPTLSGPVSPSRQIVTSVGSPSASTEGILVPPPPPPFLEDSVRSVSSPTRTSSMRRPQTKHGNALYAGDAPDPYFSGGSFSTAGSVDFSSMSIPRGMHQPSSATSHSQSRMRSVMQMNQYPTTRPRPPPLRSQSPRSPLRYNSPRSPPVRASTVGWSSVAAPKIVSPRDVMFT
eukprot:TRINITY_DN4763_c0_g5_i1.p1 TRINITY_DN4763_c0_g5~~TRINITY_DN4763_c0_g5_i1.p1  ORF type:complete len:380 (+),score=35.14 TRINITY_DN4763_c0_g5_i1:70-1209(+)